MRSFCTQTALKSQMQQLQTAGLAGVHLERPFCAQMSSFHAMGAFVHNLSAFGTPAPNECK